MSKLKEDHIGLVIDAKTEQAQQGLRQLERATSDLRKEMNARQKVMLDLEAAGKKETDEYKNLQAEVRKYNAVIKENEAEMKKMRSELDINAMTMSQLRKQAKDLQTALNNTSKAAHPKEYEQLASQLRNVNGRIAELKADTSRLSETMGQQTGGIASKFQSMFSTVSANWTKFVGMIGAAIASVSAVIAGAKWWYNYNTGIEEAQRLTREFTGLSGDALMQARSQIQAIASTFGKEYKDVLSSVDALMVQYGISASEAMKVVQDGFAAGADLGGNMLSMINQYAPAFNDAGIGASQLVAIIAQTRSGIFSEGGMALIQMASKKIREMSSATASSLDAIGVSSKQVEADLKSGTKNTFDVIQQISTALKKIPQDSQEVGNVLKDVFGRQGAAGGLKMIESLADMTTKMEDVKKVTGEYGELQEQEVEAQTRLNEKMSKFFGLGDQGFEEITMKAKIFAMNALSKIIDYTVKIINYFVDLYNESTKVRGTVELLKVGFKTLWEVAKLGAYLVIDAFKAVGRMGKAVASILEGASSFDIDKISKGAQGVVKAYKESFSELLSDAKKFGKSVGTSFVDAFNNTVNKKPVAHVSVDLSPSSIPQSPSQSSAGGTGNGGNGKKKNNKKKTKGTDPDDIASRQFSHDRSQDLDDARRAYQEDLGALRKALAEKRLTQEQYNAYISTLNIQHQNNLLAIETSYQERSRAIAIKDATKRRLLQEQQDKAVADQHQAATNAYIESEKQYYDALSQMREAGMSDRDKQELDHKLQLSSLEAFYKSALEIARKNGEDEVALTEAYEAAKAKIISKHTEQAESDRLQFRRQYGLAAQQELFDAELEQLKKSLDEKGATQQEKEQAVANLTKEFEERKFQIRQQYGLATQQELYNAELEQLKQHLQNKMMTEEEYEEAVKQMKFDRWKESFDYYSNLFGNALKSLQDAEVANVNAKYDAEIEAAKNAGKDTTELEKKKANETLKIQKKYADVDFAMTASKIIADTAGAIMGAWHTFKGNPVAAGIVTALISATSLAQLAAANSERQKVKKLTLSGGSGSSSASGTRVATGLESGGSIDVEREQDGRRFHAAYEPGRRGYINRPTVLVGEGPAGRSKEWVASNAAVENPTVSPLIDIIDHAQRAGTIRTLDMNKFFIRQAAGRASGGFLSPQAGPSAPAPSVGYAATPSQPSTLTSPVLDRLCLLLDRLASEGIPASVALDEIEQKQQLRDQARKIGSK